MLLATQLPRVFTFKNGTSDLELPDPNPAFSEQAVLNFYAGQYPILTTAKLSGPVIEGDKICYKFESVMGTKG